MIDEKMETMLNKQLNAELYSSNLYLAMAAWFGSQHLGGLAHWLETQATEEREHAMRLYTHLRDRRATIQIGTVAAPPAGYKSPVAAFEAVFDHEVEVSQMIYRLVEAATTERDFTTVNMLQWFISEQVEDEAGCEIILEHLRMANGSAAGFLQIDHEVGKSVKPVGVGSAT